MKKKALAFFIGLFVLSGGLYLKKIFKSKKLAKSEDNILENDSTDASVYASNSRSVASVADTIGKSKNNKHDILSAISKLEACYDSNCKIPSRDPREYDLELSKALKLKLHELADFVLENEIQAEWVSEIARKHLDSSNGHVKEGALALISTQAPSEENLKSVVTGVIHFHNPFLMSGGLMELEKYKESEWGGYLKDNFLQALKSGSVVSKQVLSKKISPFINDKNAQDYERYAKELPYSSQVRKDLLAIIQNR